MTLIRNVESLNFEISLLEKRRRTLRDLFNKGKISQSTFDLLDKKISKIESLIMNLKDMIQEETGFWNSIASEKTRVLESILANFRFLNIIGEIDVDEWMNISKTISLGVEALDKKPFSKHKEKISEVDAEESSINVDFKDTLPPLEETSDALDLNREEKADNMRINRKPVHSKAINFSDSHCMNPWKPECRRTNIKLSIYYKGRFLPICEECWKEISKKNIEWSI